MILQQHIKKVTIAALCVACIAPAEGLRRMAYNDPVGIPTICFGETRGVKLGDKATTEECKDMLGKRVAEDFVPGVERCITQPMQPKLEASFVSLAYNIGVEHFCRSSVAHKYNAGDTAGACNAMLEYVYARGIKLPGLVTRREKERALCLEGVA
jgi:lysozyme